MVPRLEYVASQYQIPDMYEYVIYNEPQVAVKLKIKKLQMSNCLKSENMFESRDSKSLAPTIVKSEYCFLNLFDY